MFINDGYPNLKTSTSEIRMRLSKSYVSTFRNCNYILNRNIIRSNGVARLPTTVQNLRICRFTFETSKYLMVMIFDIKPLKSTYVVIYYAEG